jgi:hypothetical protein
MPGDLTPRQRELLQHLFEQELRRVLREQSARCLAHDGQHPLDQNREGGGVAEQR